MAQYVDLDLLAAALETWLAASQTRELKVLLQDDLEICWDIPQMTQMKDVTPYPLPTLWGLWGTCWGDLFL